MPCDVQTRLLEAWNVSTHEFSVATAALTGNQIRTMPREQYMELRAKAERARLAYESAGSSLELHCNEHGCVGAR